MNTESNIKNTIHQCVDLLNQRDTNKVKQLLIPIVNNNPENFHALHLLGLAFHLNGELKQAISLLERALAINPDFPAVQHNAAGVYRALGQMQKAEACYRKAIKLKADYAEAYQGLSEIIRFKVNDPLIKSIKKQLAYNTDNNLAMYFHFTLGKIYDDCADYDLAYKHYDKANCSSGKDWSGQQHESFQQAVKKTYTKSYFRQRTISGCQSQAPVFIVGMPRSGSTLVEQILASHSRVFAAGEISDMQNIADQLPKLIKSEQSYPFCIPELSEEACKGIGEAYLNRVQKIEGAFENATRFIDKNLYNFNHIGLITDLLPNAHIIHIERHPLDCSLSNYFQNFSKGMLWSFRIENIIKFYAGYHAMINHWQKVLPIKILDVCYEELIMDTETVSRKIIDFCKLPWEASCLDFHNTKRTVKTASLWQVRQPIYKSSQARWQRYAKHIGPLQKGLADYIHEYEARGNQG